MAQHPGQEKDDHRPQNHRPPGEEKGGKEAEHDCPHQGGDVAGDGGDDHRNELNDKVHQVGPGRELGDIGLHGRPGVEGLEKASGVQGVDAATQQGYGDKPQQGLFDTWVHNFPPPGKR